MRILERDGGDTRERKVSERIVVRRSFLSVIVNLSSVRIMNWWDVCRLTNVKMLIV